MNDDERLNRLITDTARLRTEADRILADARRLTPHDHGPLHDTAHTKAVPLPPAGPPGTIMFTHPDRMKKGKRRGRVGGMPRAGARAWRAVPWRDIGEDVADVVLDAVSVASAVLIGLMIGSHLANYS